MDESPAIRKNRIASGDGGRFAAESERWIDSFFDIA